MHITFDIESASYDIMDWLLEKYSDGYSYTKQNAARRASDLYDAVDRRVIDEQVASAKTMSQRSGGVTLSDSLTATDEVTQWAFKRYWMHNACAKESRDFYAQCSRRCFELLNKTFS